MPFTLRTMDAADWPVVEAIYAAGMATGNATFETELPSWEGWDATHLPSARMVACNPAGAVIGWAALSPVSARRAYRGVAEVSVYVAPMAWRRGVGSALLAALIAVAASAGLWTLQASIFRENTSSVRLHQRHGFRIVGFRERIAEREGQWRDTLLLELRLPTPDRPAGVAAVLEAARRGRT